MTLRRHNTMKAATKSIRKNPNINKPDGVLSWMKNKVLSGFGCRKSLVREEDEL